MTGEYMNAKEAAEYLRVSVAVLKRVCPGIKVSPRRMVWRKVDLDSYVESQAKPRASD